MDDTPVSSNQPLILQGANKYLVIVLVCFVVIIAILFTLIEVNKKKIAENEEAATEQIREEQKKIAALPSVQTLIAQNTKENPMNKVMFDDVKKQLKPNEQLVSTGRMHGKVLEITNDTTGLYVLLESYLPNMKGKQIWYSYPPALLARVTVFEGESAQTPSSIAEIVVNSEVHIDERNDYSKAYPDSVVSVKITLL